MEPTLALAFSLFGMTLGVLATYLLGNSHHRRQLASWDASITKDLQARVATYAELKVRVMRLFHMLEVRGDDFRRRLRNQKEYIANLEHALEAGPALAPALLGIFASEGSTEGHQTFGQLLARREEELESWKVLYHELKATNETQVQLLEQCVEGLMPRAEDLEVQEELVTLWRTKVDLAEAEAATKIDELESRVVDLEPIEARVDSLETELAVAREEAATWRSKCQSAEHASSVAQAEVAELREASVRVCELEREVECQKSELEFAIGEVGVGLTETRQALAQREQQSEAEKRAFLARTTELEHQLEAWQAAFATSEEKLSASTEELESLRAALAKGQAVEEELGLLKSSLARVQTRVEELEAAVAGKSHGLAEVVAELELARVRISDLDAERVETREVLARHVALAAEQKQTLTDAEAQAELRTRVLESELEGLTTRLAASEDELELRAQHFEERAHDVAELERALQDVLAKTQELEVALDASTGASTEKQALIEELQERLAQVSNEANSQRAAVLTKNSTFQEAHSLIEAMRPILEGLENTLRNGEE